MIWRRTGIVLSTLAGWLVLLVAGEVWPTDPEIWAYLRGWWVGCLTAVLWFRWEA